jgi:hypothetical protein
MAPSPASSPRIHPSAEPTTAATLTVMLMISAQRVGSLPGEPDVPVSSRDGGRWEGLVRGSRYG